MHVIANIGTESHNIITDAKHIHPTFFISLFC